MSDKAPWSGDRGWKRTLAAAGCLLAWLTASVVAAQVPCTTDGDCAAPLVCVAGECAWDPILCASDSECEEGFVCQLDPVKEARGACSPELVPCPEEGCRAGWICFDLSDATNAPPQAAGSNACIPDGLVAVFTGQAGIADESSEGLASGGVKADAPRDMGPQAGMGTGGTAPASGTRDAGGCTVAARGPEQTCSLVLLCALSLAIRRRGQR